MFNQIMPTVSIILPVYNAALYIRRAVESVLLQSFRDFELLVIDDGSTDGTNLICDEYALKDSRVKVIHKSNGGIASARQTGLNNVKGKYCIHFDADDYADSRMLEDMYRIAAETGADVVVADFFIRMKEDEIITSSQYFNQGKPSERIIDILNGTLFGALWNKLIRTSAIYSSGANFEPNINLCEDNLFLAKLLRDERLIVVHHNVAHYTYCRDVTTSFTHSYDEDTFKRRLQYFRCICGVLPEEKYKLALQSEAWRIKMQAYSYGFLELCDFDQVFPDNISFIWNSTARKKDKIVLIFYLILHMSFLKTKKGKCFRV